MYNIIMYSLLCNRSILFMHLYHTIIQFIHAIFTFLQVMSLYNQSLNLKLIKSTIQLSLQPNF